MKKSIDVVGAVIHSAGKILCTQRGPQAQLPGKWEFPGGKLERGESPRQALAREIHEELHCHVEVGDLVTTTRHEYEFAVVRLTTFYCELLEGSPQLTEHIAAEWLDPSSLPRLDWAPADIPAVRLISQQLRDTPVR